MAASGYGLPPAPPTIDDGLNQVNDFGHQAMNLLREWGPRVLTALVILVIGWLIARAVKWAIASVVNKSPLGKHANDPAHHDRHPSTVGAQIGNAAFWLIILASVMAAAKPLGLADATGPLSAMMSDFGNAIPNIIGAVLIFFVGYIVASVAKKAVEAGMTVAHAERLTSRVGISPSSAASLPKIIGSVVFALIIIPVAIAALEKLNIRSISDPATQMLRLVLDAIPHVIAAGIIVALAVFIGRFASTLLSSFLSGMGFDDALHSMGLFPSASATTGGATSRVRVSPAVGETSSSASASASASTGAMSTPSGIVGTLVMVAIVMFGLIEAFRQLNFEYGSRIIAQILTLLGSVTFGAIIIAASVAIASFVSRIVASSTGPGMAATGVRLAIIVLGTAIGLRYMGLADDIINLAFGLILGAAALAAALAFGLGGRQAAARLTDKIAAQTTTGSPPSPTTPASPMSQSTMRSPPSSTL